MRDYRLIIGLAIVLAGCQASKVSLSSVEPYREDLSPMRPVLKSVNTELDPLPESLSRNYAPARLTATQQLNPLLDSISQVYLSRNQVEGFTIQVFTTNKKEQALQLRKQFVESFPEVACELQFIEPIYKIKAGKYFSKVEAMADFPRIKSTFETAILVPERFPIFVTKP